MFFHHLSLSATIVGIIALMGFCFTLVIKERGAAILHFRLAMLFTCLLYVGSGCATLSVNSIGAYHRWLTVACSLFGLVHINQFFLHFETRNLGRVARAMLPVQWLGAFALTLFFIFATYGAPRFFRFDAHYWDLEAAIPGRIVAVALIVYVLIFAGTAIWRISRADRRKLVGLSGMLVGFLVAFFVPGVTLFLFRMGLINAPTFANSMVVAVGIGFFLLFFFFINYADIHTSVLSKIVMISLLTSLIIIELIGSLVFQPIEDAYDDRKRYETTELLLTAGPGRGGPALIDLAYVQPVSPRPEESRREAARIYRRTGETLTIAYRAAEPRTGEFYEVGYDYIAYRRHIDRYVFRMFLGVLGTLALIVGGFRLFFQGAIIRPLQSMIDAVKRVDAGNLKVSLDVGVEDEIGFLSRSFNAMVLSIKDSRQELQQYTRNLERKVRERDSFQSLPVRNIAVPNATLTYASKSLEAVVERIEKIAPLDQAVLVTGETGTGKELIARLLHEKGRGDRPFIDVNCAAIPAALWESEIFGHVRGAFTDARAERQGLVAQAGDGTLFFDEIGELPPAVQPKILRLLQERQYQMVGGKTRYPAQCRIIFATHRNLLEMVNQGQFREDLYYRINVLEIDIPPLRERKADIPVLFDAMIRKYSAQMNIDIQRIDEEVIDALVWHPWRGNVRELENAVIKILANVSGDSISLADLPPNLLETRGETAADANESGPGFEEAIEIFSRELIQRALAKSDGNVSQAARILKISRGKLQYQMRGLNLSE